MAEDERPRDNSDESVSPSDSDENRVASGPEDSHLQDNAAETLDGARSFDTGALARALENVLAFDADAAAGALANARRFDTGALARALESVLAFDANAAATALGNARTFDTDAVANLDQLQMWLAPKKLVPETALDESADDEEEELKRPSPTEHVPEDLSRLMEALRNEGFDPELHARTRPAGFEVRFDLPAGRSKRSVTVREDAAPILLRTTVSSWRSLQRYDGIWSSSEGVIEIALRGERFGPTPRLLVRRLAGVQGVEGESPPRHEATDARSGTIIRIGEASETASVLLAAPNRPHRQSMTLRLMNVHVSTTEDADALAERVADALSFDLHVLVGVPLLLQRLESRDVVARQRRSRWRGSLQFPENSYPHAPIVLYQAGLERTTPPLIRYWSFYQVLEYFFPKYSQVKAINHLGRHLRSPTFNAHREADVLKAVELAAIAAGKWGSEVDQLLTTLEAITTPAEVLRLAEELNLAAQLTTKSELTTRTINANRGDSIMLALSERIYDIRCRIVHSKGSSHHEGGPGLLPGTHHDDLVTAELPLMEFIAQQALINAAEPLNMSSGTQPS